MTVDALDVLEAAYAVEASQRAWLERLSAVTYAQIGEEDGLIAFPYQITSAGTLQPHEMVCFNLPPSMEQALHGIVCSFPPEYVRNTFARFPSAMATRIGTPEGITATRALLKSWRDQFGWPWHDFLVINGVDPSGYGLYLGVPLRAEGTLTSRQRAKWDRIATHLSAAHRLRRRLTPVESARPDTADAILSASGKLEHANAEASTATAQRTLRDAAKTIDRARGKMRRREPERALAEWTGLISARWTLLDHFDSDGKRYVLARRNDAPIQGLQTLTERERQVLGYAALGHTNKLIAYELGISASTVGVLLHRAAKKLRAKSRADLIAKFQHIAFTPPP